jgi:hypothetical protein
MAASRMEMLQKVIGSNALTMLIGNECVTSFGTIVPI